MKKPYKYDEWKATLDKENPTLDALDSYHRVVVQFLNDKSSASNLSILINAKLYTDYYLYEYERKE